MEGTLYKKGKYWYVIVDLGKDENGKRKQKWHNTKCEDKKEAVKVQREILISLDKGMYVEPQNKSFSEFILEWLDDDIKVNNQITTYNSYKLTINKHIVPYFKNIQLQKLQPVHVQRFYSTLLKKGLSPNTVRHHHANIHKCLDYALKMGLVSRNVSDAVTLPKMEKYKANFYDGKQIQKLLKVVKDTYIETPVTVTIAMGLRRGEVLGLKWENVNLDTAEMLIINNRVRSGDKGIIDKTTKTESSIRTLSIPDYIVKYLKQLKLKQEQNKKWVFGDTYIDKDYVCCRDDGKPLEVTYVSQVFKKVLEDNKLPHIRFHDLRHSNASYLLKQGVSIKELQGWLGHSSFTTTADIYAHIDVESKKSIAKKSNMMFKNVK